MNSEKKWKVAVIGCGMFANGQYFPNITKEANAVCVAACDIVPGRAQAFAEKFGIPAAFEDYHDVLALEGLDDRVEILWNDISLQDITEEAKAQMYQAQAAKYRMEAEA